MGQWQYDQVKAARDAAQPKLRFVVYDLYRVAKEHGELQTLDAEGFPRGVPPKGPGPGPWQREMFPLNQPVVYRSPSGRYVVATVKHDVPLGECKISHEIGIDKYPELP